jgi:hypothetical protein
MTFWAGGLFARSGAFHPKPPSLDPPTHDSCYLVLFLTKRRLCSSITIQTTQHTYHHVVAHPSVRKIRYYTTRQ